jgi:hypothetical protein
MKMFVCHYCDDIVAIRHDEMRSCYCGKSSAKYIIKNPTDDRDVQSERIVLFGPCTTLVIRNDDLSIQIANHMCNPKKRVVPMYLLDLSKDTNIIHHDNAAKITYEINAAAKEKYLLRLVELYSNGSSSKLEWKTKRWLRSAANRTKKMLADAKSGRQSFKTVEKNGEIAYEVR